MRWGINTRPGRGQEERMVAVLEVGEGNLEEVDDQSDVPSLETVPLYSEVFRMNGLSIDDDMLKVAQRR